MAPIRIALLGAGGMAGMHAAAYAELRDVELRAVVGRRGERAATLAARYGALATTDADAVLADPAVDAVDVCTPTASHAELVERALERGKQVLCETPLAGDAATARRLAAAGRASGRLLQVALLSRFAQPGARVRELAGGGTWGAPVCFTALRLWPGPQRGAPRAPDDHHGDALEELALFDLDYLAWTLGMPARLTATAPPPHGRGEVDHVLVALEYASGATAFVEASRILPDSFPFRIEGRMVLERGMVEWVVRFERPGPPTMRIGRHPHGGAAEISEELEENPYLAECRHFVACVRGDGDPALLSAEAAVEGLTVVDAARRSLAERRPVQL
ncbi:MAG: Gfo/Idh/MocA family oxidoreductase [Thermodesulfobacteriota bacterium]